MTVLLSANRLDRHLVKVRFPSSEKYVRGYWSLKVRGFALWSNPEYSLVITPQEWFWPREMHNPPFLRSVLLATNI